MALSGSATRADECLPRSGDVEIMCVIACDDGIGVRER